MFSTVSAKLELTGTKCGWLDLFSQWIMLMHSCDFPQFCSGFELILLVSSQYSKNCHRKQRMYTIKEHSGIDRGNYIIFTLIDCQKRVNNIDVWVIIFMSINHWREYSLKYAWFLVVKVNECMDLLVKLNLLIMLGKYYKNIIFWNVNLIVW